MNRGYVRLYRKSLGSPVFGHEGLWKLFCLCMMKANHKEAEVMLPGILKPILLNPGQFVTGRYALWENYHQLHLTKRHPRKPAPSVYSVWRWLLTLQQMQILSIKSTNKYSIITICNWNQYQGNDHQVSIRRASSEHKQTLNKNDKETPDLFSLKKRYDQSLIDKCFDAIKTTRRRGRVVDSVFLKLLQKMIPYPVKQVEAGIRIFLERDYAKTGHLGRGKGEKYLMGIIRNQKEEPDTAPAPVYLSNEELIRDA